MPKAIPYESEMDVPVRKRGSYKSNPNASANGAKSEMSSSFKQKANKKQKMADCCDVCDGECGGGCCEACDSCGGVCCGGEKESEDGQSELKISEFAGVLPQIKVEKSFAEKFIQPKWKKWAMWLKLYNNQKRDAEAIGDPLLFTIFQTILAALYTDQLTVQFIGRERGDDETAENQTLLAEYDSEEMEKDQLDYEWIFDTLFTGRGLVLMDEWDDETHTPIPEVIDPFTFLRDPDAKSINGTKRGRGACRFFGREIRMSKYELEEAGVYENLECLDKDEEVKSNTQTDEMIRARREAQGFDDMREKLCGDNQTYVLHEWWTRFNNKRYQFTLGKNCTVLLRVKEIKTKKWPVIDRTIFPSAHEWEGVSIPALCEDKQRGRAILLNLAKKGVTANLYPNYLYNNQMIKNKADLLKWEFNKFIGVSGNPQGVVAPIERKTAVTTDVQWMLDQMDAASQKATATPDIQQGAITEKVKSATEIAKVTQGVDTRYSANAKIFGWSEKRLWKLWYELYNIYFSKDIDTKIARIAGPFGPQYRRINRDNLIGNADPDVIIESKVISDAKRMNRLNMLMAVLNQSMALDNTTNKRFGLKEIMKSAGMTTDEINRLLPKTYDEYEAEEENKLLDKNKMPKIMLTQNHMTHIEIHSKAADGKAKQVHIEMHKLALYAQTHNAMLVAEAQAQQATAAGAEGAPPGPPRPPGSPPPSPMETGATPAPRDMSQSPLQLQSPTAIQMAQ